MKDSLMLTVLAGVLIFFISQFILKRILEPIVAFKNVLKELSALFLREQSKITNACASNETQQELRRLASSILAHKKVIFGYRAFAVIRWMPREEFINESCCSLNLIASMLDKDYPVQVNKDIRSVCTKIFNEMESVGEKLNITVTYGNAAS